MLMLSGQQTAAILLSLSILLLGCYLGATHFHNSASTNKAAKGSFIRIKPLNIIEKKEDYDFSIVLDPGLQRAHSPPPTDSVLVGQNLRFGQDSMVQLKMYADRSFLQEKYSFTASEKIFLVIELDNLEAGHHNLKVLWNNPNLKLVNTSHHSLTLPSKTLSHRSYFWLKLIKNGKFTELFTGDEYKGKIHGMWDAEIYLDGTRLGSQHFMVLD